MGAESKIQWTDHTFNAWIGCEKVSPGCKHCYAEVDTFARAARGRGLELWGGNAARHVTSEAYWMQPARWNRRAAERGVRERVFCSSLSDVFEDRPNPRPGYHYEDTLRWARARLWQLIHETPYLDWLLLTKRPENADRLALAAWSDAFACATHDNVPDAPWMPNIWLGTTVEDQRRADERIPHLLATPAAVRFLSCEPLLGPVDLERWLYAPTRCTACGSDRAWYDTNPRGLPTIATCSMGVPQTGEPGATRCSACGSLDVDELAPLSWVIVGGESGPGARPMDLAWARSIVTQCRAASVPVFVKQLGAKPVVLGEPTGRFRTGPEGTRQYEVAATAVPLRDRKGGALEEFPEDLRIREFPAV